MALIQCKLFSKELFRSVNVNVVLPLPDSNNCFFESATQFPHDGKKYQVLWLLHGFSADESDWQRFSRIESYAMEKNLAVVMPDGYNSMYADNPWGGNYFSYLTKELPAMLQSFLPLSPKREHNSIAGLSMGGGGAFTHIKFIKPKQGVKVSADPDDYEFEDEEYENEDVLDEENKNNRHPQDGD